MAMNAPRCSHGKALIDCRRTCRKTVSLPDTDQMADAIHAGAYRNHSAVHHLFIGGDIMEDAMQEVIEKCSAKSASVGYLKHDAAEDMPAALDAYVEDRNHMNLSSIVVSLMPSRSTALCRGRHNHAPHATSPHSQITTNASRNCRACQ